MADWEEADADGSVWPAVLVATTVLAVLGGIAVMVMRVTRKAEAQADQQLESAAQRRRQAPQQQDRQEGTGRGTATNRMQQRLRRRRDAAAAAAAGTTEDRHAQEGSRSDESGGEAEAEPVNRGEQRRPQQAAADAHRMTKQQAYDDRRRAKDDAREAEEEALAAEIARLDAVRLAEQDAEAAKWMGQISLEGQGTGEEEASNAEAQVADFVAFIKEHKTVPLDDLAAQFNMRTQDIITRIEELEAHGQLTGVMDDRGKFIYISPSEMEAVAAFLRQRGRVAIAELAARSDELIDLEARAEPGEGDAAAAQDLFGEETNPAPVIVS